MNKKEKPLPEVVDLDAYRKKREAEGSWPPSDFDTHQYWKAQRRALLRNDQKRSV
jgi:hypothetical protein